MLPGSIYQHVASDGVIPQATVSPLRRFMTRGGHCILVALALALELFSAHNWCQGPVDRYAIAAAATCMHCAFFKDNTGCQIASTF